MFKKFFAKNNTEKSIAKSPEIMGLGIGSSFEIDKLLIKLIIGKLSNPELPDTHFVSAAGITEIDGTTLFRFYTNNDSWLQVITSNGTSEADVIDVKLFRYYDTLDVSNEKDWGHLLRRQIGNNTYQLGGHLFNRVWEAVNDYHQPVHLVETTHDETGESETTDQFVMLFERPLDNNTESLYLSAEEKQTKYNTLDRCFVRSTGITLTPSQITIYG
ncbi:MAG: YjfK family protein [Gammaproteobacteria bacterium]|nr:YjfK family protein [Gammaproteobacteria bacterium]